VIISCEFCYSDFTVTYCYSFCVVKKGLLLMWTAFGTCRANILILGLTASTASFYGGHSANSYSNVVAGWPQITLTTLFNLAGHAKCIRHYGKSFVS